jgi:hypothetical protein
MLLGLLATLLIAQAPQSSIAGVVRDGKSGAPLKDAEVSLTAPVAPDSLGRYILPLVSSP